MEKERQAGFAFHVHHDQLMEFCFDYAERIEYIKNHKPQGEQKLRLRLFRLIPPRRLPQALIGAWEVYDKAREACDKAREACDKAWEVYDKAREARNKAREACDKAWEARDKAREACMPEIIKLHEELCPNCTWDGKTIFVKWCAI